MIPAAAILTLNVMVGIALIAQANLSAVGITGYSLADAVTLAGVLASSLLATGCFWAWISDKNRRMAPFDLMLGLQGVCLLIIPHAKQRGSVPRARRHRLPVLRPLSRNDVGDRC